MKILFAFLLALSSFSASANLAPMLKPFAATSTTVTHVGGSVVNVGTNYMGRNAANSAVYGFRNVSVPKASLASLIKKRAGQAFMNPWLIAALVAADYFFDSETGEISLPSVGDLLPASTTGYCFGIYFGSYSGTWSSCQASIQNTVDVLRPSFHSVYSVNEGNRWFFHAQNTDNPPIVDVAKFYPDDTSLVSAYPSPAMQPDLASDDDLLTLAGSFSPSQWSNIWKNPDTHRIDDVQPMADAGTDLTSDYNASNDSDPLTEPTTDPATGDNGGSSVDDVPPEEDQELLCDKYPDIIACQELDESPNDPIPNVETEEVSTSFSSEVLSSSASCPSDGSASVQGQSISFSYQPICDVATSIAPLFIALCSIVGIYILVGGVRD